MRVELKGAVAMVTGASSGIGLEIARQLAPKVGGLILVARRVDRLEALAGELRSAHAELDVRVEPCDLSKPDQVADLVVRAGAVDVLVNNAGLGDIALFERTAWHKLELMLLVNINALTQLTRLLVDGMIARKRGAILNISSGFGLAWMPGAAAYAATKHYVTAFSEALRLELHGVGINVTQVCPGPVATEFEDVAGNPTGQEVPGWLQIDAVQCARESVAGFEKGKALVTPGFAMKVLMFFTRMTPRWVSRLVLGGVDSYLRKRPA